MKLFRTLAASLVIVALSFTTASSANFYWDTNGTTAGAGTGGVASGTWDTTTANWQTTTPDSPNPEIPADPTGVNTPGVWENGRSAVFSAGGDATGDFNVTIPATTSVSATNLTIEEGNVTFVSAAGGGTVNVSGTIDVATNSSAAFNTTFITLGGGAITKTGGGTVFGGNGETFTGGAGTTLTINAGTWDIVGETGLGAVPGAFNANAVVINNNATLRVAATTTLNNNRGLNIGTGGATIEVTSTTISGFVTGNNVNGLNGSTLITKTGNGRFTITPSGTTFSGKYNVLAGAVNVAGDTRFGPVPGGVVSDYFTLDGANAGIRISVTSGVTLNANRGITLGAGGGTLMQPGPGTLTYNGVISGTSGGALRIFWNDNVDGTGLGGGAAGGIVVLGGANTYDGATTVGAGTTLRLGASGVVPDGSALTVNSTGIFDMNSLAETIGSLAGAGNVTMSAALTTGGNDASTTYSGVASGAGALTKTGTGTMKLTGNNTYTGGTTVSGGVLQIGDGAATGAISNTGTLTNDASVVFNRGSTFAYNGTITGTGTVTHTASAGILTLGGTNSYSGLTTISAGQITANNANSLGTTAAGTTVESGATLGVSGALTNAEPLIISGMGVGGTGAIFKSVGNATVLSGGITLAADSRINIVNTGSASLTISTNALALGANNLNFGSGDKPITISAPITGSGNITKDNINSLNVSADNSTYTGNFVINAGRLQPQANDNALGDTTGNTQIASGAGLVVDGMGNNRTLAEPISIAGVGAGSDGGAITVQNSSVSTFTGPITLTADAQVTVAGSSGVTYSNANAFTGNDFNLTIQGGAGAGAGGTISGAIALGTGGLTKLQGGKWVLSGNNTYDGATSISAGTLVAASNNALGSTVGATTVASNAALGFQGNVNYTTAESVSIAGTGATNNSGLRGAIENISDDNTFAGPVTMTADSSIGATAGKLTLSNNVGGGFNLTKVGAGTLVLANAAGNDYGGTTAVNAGTLLVNNTSGSGTGAGAVTVATGGTLGGNGFITGTVTVQSGGTFSPGASIDSIDVGSLTIDSGAILNFEVGAPSSADLITVTDFDGLTLNGGTVNITDYTGLGAGTYTLINYDATTALISGLSLATPDPVGFDWELDFNSGNTSIDLVVTATGGVVLGDYNENDVVDSADYAMWRMLKQTGGSLGPTEIDTGSGVGVTDDADYTAWRNVFGNITGASAASNLGANQPVPEPATMVMLLGLAAAAMTGRRR